MARLSAYVYKVYYICCALDVYFRRRGGSGHPFPEATALSIQGTIVGINDPIVSSVPPFPKRDAVCVDNDNQRATYGARNGTGDAHPTSAHLERYEDVNRSTGRYRNDIRGYRIGRIIMFRGHVTVQSPSRIGGKVGLEDGYFEFPLYAFDTFPTRFPPTLVPVSKAEAALEPVFDPFKAKFTFKTRRGQQY
jgi:hypothetical protein